MPVPPIDPFSDSDSNWLLWPMKTWPWPVRVALIFLLVLGFGVIMQYGPRANSSPPTNLPQIVAPAIEESTITPVEPVLGPESSVPAPVDCSGPFTLMDTTLEQFVACADVVGVERHEVGCTEPTCYKWRRGCPVLDDSGRLMYLLMPGEYIAILRDGRLIRSDGPLPIDRVGVTQCAEAPP